MTNERLRFCLLAIPNDEKQVVRRILHFAEDSRTTSKTIVIVGIDGHFPSTASKSVFPTIREMKETLGSHNCDSIVYLLTEPKPSAWPFSFTLSELAAAGAFLRAKRKRFKYPREGASLEGTYRSCLLKAFARDLIAADVLPKDFPEPDEKKGYALFEQAIEPVPEPPPPKETPAYEAMMLCLANPPIRMRPEDMTPEKKNPGSEDTRSASKQRTPVDSSF
jgi:hypothetical protein